MGYGPEPHPLSLLRALVGTNGLDRDVAQVPREPVEAAGAVEEAGFGLTPAMLTKQLLIGHSAPFHRHVVLVLKAGYNWKT